MKLLLASLALLLALALSLQWLDWGQTPARLPQTDANATQDATPSLPALPNVADLLTPPPPQEEYAAVIDRPLFLPDRRMPPPSEVEPGPSQSPESTPVDETAIKGLDFSAVLITDNKRIALVRLPTQPKLLRWRPGDDYNGWKVEDIQAHRLLLSSQGTEKAFDLRDYVNTPPRIIPPTPVPRAPADQPPQGLPGPLPDGAMPPPPPGQSEPTEVEEEAPRRPSFGPSG